MFNEFDYKWKWIAYFIKNCYYFYSLSHTLMRRISFSAKIEKKRFKSKMISTESSSFGHHQTQKILRNFTKKRQRKNQQFCFMLWFPQLCRHQWKITFERIQQKRISNKSNAPVNVEFVESEKMCLKPNALTIHWRAFESIACLLGLSTIMMCFFLSLFYIFHPCILFDSERIPSFLLVLIGLYRVISPILHTFFSRETFFFSDKYSSWVAVFSIYIFCARFITQSQWMRMRQ